MVKIKTKDYERASYSLRKDIKERINEIAENKGISNTQLIENLVSSASINDVEKIKRDIEMMENEILNKEFDISQIKKDINKKKKLMKKIEAWNTENSNRTLEAVEVIKRFLLRNDNEKAEKYARSRTDIDEDWIDLIYRAKQELEVSGI